jgi:hypothetical protein
MADGAIRMRPFAGVPLECLLPGCLLLACFDRAEPDRRAPDTGCPACHMRAGRALAGCKDSSLGRISSPRALWGFSVSAWALLLQARSGHAARTRPIQFTNPAMASWFSALVTRCAELNRKNLSRREMRRNNFELSRSLSLSDCIATA